MICFIFFKQKASNGIQDFNEVTKFSLAELQVGAEELPSGVDPSAREVLFCFVLFVYFTLCKRKS